MSPFARHYKALAWAASQRRQSARRATAAGLTHFACRVQDMRQTGSGRGTMARDIQIAVDAGVIRVTYRGDVEYEATTQMLRVLSDNPNVRLLFTLVDGNYPAEEQANRLVRADGHQLIPVLDAILSVLPVDDFVPEALFRASVKGDPALADPVHREMEAICARRAPGHKVVALAGADFYARVRSAHAIVATSEPRLYANIIIRKGVIYPPEDKKP